MALRFEYKNGRMLFPENYEISVLCCFFKQVTVFFGETTQ